MRLPLPRRRPRCERWTAGSAAIEFAITAPIVLALAVGLADYATIAGQTGALISATRAGAEYAIAAPTDTTGAAAAVTAFMSFPAGVTACTFSSLNAASSASSAGTAGAAGCAPASSIAFCTCTDGTNVACPQPGQSSPQANPCSAEADPRVLQYVAAAAQQSVSPLPFTGLSLPTTLNAASYLRWQ